MTSIKEQPSSTRDQLTLLLFALIVGVLYDFLFYDKVAGISVPIFVIAFYTLFWWGIRSGAALQPRLQFSWLLLIPIFLLSLTYVLFDNPVFHMLNGLAIPMLIAFQTTLTAGKHDGDWGRIRFVRYILEHTIPRALINMAFPFSFVKKGMKNRIDEGRLNTLKKILLGLVISLPLLWIVILLLSSADLMFSRMISELPDLLLNVNLGETIYRGLWVVLIGLYLFGYIRGMLVTETRSDEKVSDSVDGDVSKKVQNDTKKVQDGSEQIHLPSLDPVVAGTILTVINLVYILFVFIQFSYFFGGGMGTLPSDITYAEYARSGFMELMLVTVINFTILLMTLHMRKQPSSSLRKMLRVLLTLLVVCTFVMLISAYSRLTLYEEAYGYTRFRLLAHAFMIFLGLLFVLAFRRIWNEKVSLLRQYIVVGIIAYVIINYINIDRMIAVHNIERYQKTGRIDVYYLGRLSADSMPALVTFVEKNDGPEELKGMINAKRLKGFPKITGSRGTGQGGEPTAGWMRWSR